MDVGDASDQRIGNVYESIARVWFIERKYDKIIDLLCIIIDIQAPRLDSPMRGAGVVIDYMAAPAW